MSTDKLLLARIEALFRRDETKSKLSNSKSDYEKEQTDSIKRMQLGEGEQQEGSVVIHSSVDYDNFY